MMKLTFSAAALFVCSATVLLGQPAPLPVLVQQGSALQLHVDGKPFLIRGGEVNNSSATNPGYLEPFWPKLKALHLNTLVVPVCWDLIEPSEGQFDFSSVDPLIDQARKSGMRLVFLWFGSWKNSMSCYAPAWIKRDSARFPRAVDAEGRKQEILTAFSPENLKLDARAFAALLAHLRQIDGEVHTVIFVQVENEIGMVSCPRDHSPLADAAFAGPVAPELTDYLAKNLDQLTPEMRAAWQSSGFKKAGTWTEVFGATPAAEEIFMAWHYARYTDAVASAGKQQYPLLMYVNAALIRPGYQPGQYPSAGPLPHLFDVWKAGAPSIDFLSPDIYFQNFIDWARRYRRPGNPLFIPEAMRSQDASVNGLFAYGALDAIGFSPFGIESISANSGKYLGASFALIEQLEPLILANQGRGTMAGYLSQGPEQKEPLQIRLADCVLNVTFQRTVPPDLAEGAFVPSEIAQQTQSLPSGGLAIAIGPDEFIFGGTSVVITFTSLRAGERIGILSAEEGRFEQGQWRNLRWLSGDQTHQGRHIRLEPGEFTLQRVRLYRY